MLTAVAIALGFLNVIPVVALFRPAAMERLYGLRAETPELRVVLRHRAVLLGCVGLALLAGAVEPRLLAPAFLFAAISKVSFLVVFALEGRPGAALARVAKADAIALVALAVTAIVAWGIRADGSGQ